MRLHFTSFAALLIALGCIGCKSVGRNDLIGTWILDPDSRGNLPADIRNVNGTFVFNSDGSFTCADVPGLFYFPKKIAARPESGRGEWHLVSKDGGRQVQLDFQTIENWKDGIPYGTFLFISRRHIRFFLGDPDEGRAVEFYKR